MKKSIHTRPEWHVIHTNIIGIFNDTIGIYFKKDGCNIQFSDGGETAEKLKCLGIEIGNYRIQLLSKDIFLRKSTELYLNCPVTEFEQGKKKFLDALLVLHKLEKNSYVNPDGSVVVFL